MSLLHVNNSPVCDVDCGWVVSIRDVNCRWAIVHGFARKVDAEIALRVIVGLVGEDATSKNIVQRLKSHGLESRKRLREKCCEHLQW